MTITKIIESSEKLQQLDYLTVYLTIFTLCEMGYANLCECKHNTDLSDLRTDDKYNLCNKTCHNESKARQRAK